MNHITFSEVNVQNGIILVPDNTAHNRQKTTTTPTPTQTVNNQNKKFSTSSSTNHKIEAIALICFALLAIAFTVILLLACTVNPLIACGIIVVTISLIALFALSYHQRNQGEDVILYHKVLDRNSFQKRTELDGNKFSNSIGSITSDLKQYLNQLELEQNEKNTEENKKLYKNLIPEFSFAEKIAKDNELLIFGSDLTIATKIMDKLNSISTEEGVLIPGGSKSHAALYYIQKNKDNSFNFTILNTGDGLTIAKTLIDQNGVHYPAKKDHMVDIIYTNIEASKLSVEFFQKLLPKNNKKMSSANTLINTQFGGIKNIRIGNTHKMQNKGTCTMKCSLVHIRNRLGLDEYRKFKVFITKNSIGKFKKFKEKPLYRNNPVYDEMLEKAEKVLEAREQRANNSR